MKAYLSQKQQHPFIDNRNFGIFGNQGNSTPHSGTFDGVEATPANYWKVCLNQNLQLLFVDFGNLGILDILATREPKKSASAVKM